MQIRFENVKDVMNFLQSMTEEQIALASCIRTFLTNKHDGPATDIAMVAVVLDTMDKIRENPIMGDEHPLISTLQEAVDSCIERVQSETGLTGVREHIEGMREKANQIISRVKDGDDILSRINLN